MTERSTMIAMSYHGAQKVVPSLATPYARRLTGQTLYVDGGVSIMDELPMPARQP